MEETNEFSTLINHDHSSYEHQQSSSSKRESDKEASLVVHRVDAQVHNQPYKLNLTNSALPLLIGAQTPPGPSTSPEPAFLSAYQDSHQKALVNSFVDQRSSLSMGGPHATHEEGPACFVPQPPSSQVHNRDQEVFSNAFTFSPDIQTGMIPIHPRVEELRGRRLAKALQPTNGICRPRRVTFLVDPLRGIVNEDDEYEYDDDDDEFEQLESIREVVEDNEEEVSKQERLQLIRNNPQLVSVREENTRVRIVDAHNLRDKRYTVVSGRGIGMPGRGRPPGLSCCQGPSLQGPECSMGGPVGGPGLASTMGPGAHGPHAIPSGATSTVGSHHHRPRGSSAHGHVTSIGSGMPPPIVPSLEGEVGCPDAAALYPITHDTILHNLHARYKRDQIYTYVGTSLVSVNPYRRLALYTPEVINAYRLRPICQLPPHIYGVADGAHRGVWERNQDQVVVVAGESGSGKTEAAKLVLQYVTSVTHSDHPHPARQSLLHSHPVLEAFGNARTRRNDNSSRFGKYLDMEFDYRGEPIGGTITNYLLEKTRVTSQSPGERNFHIFYQILSGADIQTLKQLKLQRNLENYRLLRSSRHSPAETLDDRTEYHITKRALDAMGVSTEEQMDVFKLVATVLKLGNLSFSPVNNIDGTEGCALDNQYELHEICDLLLCDVDTLSSALQSRTVETHGDTVVAELSASEATRGRDALCRALYSRLFTWVVQRINESIKVKTLGRRKVLGILDMFGFEMMDFNSFEQLVINFCNEKLHQALIEVMLKEVQEDYLREGIEFVPIEVQSSKEIVDLIENRQTGLLSVLEEVSSRSDMCSSRGSNDILLQKLAHICSQHPTFEIKGGRHSHSDNNIPAESFRIRHFAGKVTYSTAGFIEKNVDSLHRHLSRAMYQCDNPILKDIFPEGNPRRTTLKRPASVSSQVLISISALVRNLRTKQPHLITCVKPNELKQPRILESALVLHQIKYLGLVEQAMVQCDGWSFRCSHDVFLSRFGMLSLHTWPMWRGAALEGCALLLADLPLTPQQYTFGRTKVYIKSQRAIQELEEYRRERLEDLAILVQKTWRGWNQRQKFRRKQNAQITISTIWRKWKLQKDDPDTSKSNLAFIKGWRCFFVLARERAREKQYLKKVENSSSIILQAYLNYQRGKLLSRLLSEPPSESPIDTYSWVATPLIVQDLSINLRRLHHKWRCYRYRLQFDQIARNRMREKVTASYIFKDRKASYPKSVSHPFLGDYVRLRQNAQWKKLAAESNDQYVVFADIVNKITRSSGKFVAILLAVSTNSLLILDQRTLQIKYRIPANDIQKISLSPFLDDIAVLHVNPPSPTADLTGSQNLNPGCLFGSDEIKRKGDLVLQTGHVIEVVTKLFLVVQNATGKPPDVNITTEFDANFGQSTVLFTFKSPGLAEVTPGQIRILRRHNRMEVML